MNEHAPLRGEDNSGRDELRRLGELPYYYQQLGKACHEAGLLGEFYGVVEAGLDYGAALAALRHELQTILGGENVDAWLEHFDIPSHYDGPEVE